MEQKIIEQIISKVQESMKETKTLYDLTESDILVLRIILERLPVTISGKLLGRLLRAAAHLIERNDDIAKEVSHLWKEK